jgi:hypothetical protein
MASPAPADVEWAKLSWTIIAALGTGMVAVATGMWTVFMWFQERRKDRREERRRMAALYVHPFLFAAEELQSRHYNILELQGLEPLTAYLIAQYFAWERAILRHGPYTGDAQVIKLTRAIRQAFATDSLGADLRIFHPEQSAIAQAMIRRVPGQLGQEIEVMPSQEFRRALRPSPPRSTLATYLGLSTSAPECSGISEIGSLSRAVATMAATHDPKVPPGARRLARVQGRLVALLAYIERREGLALFDGERRTASEERWVGLAAPNGR